MANILSAELLAAQSNVTRYPIVEIKAGQFAEDIPLAGTRINSETMDQDGAATITTDSGRLVTVYTQDNGLSPMRDIRIAYTDTGRTEFSYAGLIAGSAGYQYSDLSLTEMADGKIAMAYVLKDTNGKYHLKIATFAYDGSSLNQYAILDTQDRAIYSPSICRTSTGYLVVYIQEISITATSGGTYTGSSDSTISVEVLTDGTQATATFQWKKDDGAWTGPVTMTGYSQNLTEGVTITFAAGTYWTGQKFWYTVTAARFAIGYIMANDLPQNGDTTVIGGTTYTWRSILSDPAIANEVKIDALGREICLENLRCAITATEFEGTGEGVRYSTGTAANGAATATRDNNTMIMTALASGTGGNSITLTTDGIRLTKTAFSGGAAAVTGTCQWTPGSKIYQTTATLPSGTWATATEPSISGVLASRKKLDTALMRQTDGTIWLFFTYMDAGDTEKNAVYNLYYATSTTQGSTWNAAIELTAFTTPTEIARRPAIVQKLATELVLVYDSTKTSLSMDKTNPYWTDEGNQAIKWQHFNPANRKLYVVYGLPRDAGGTKIVNGIIRINVDTWTVDRYWNGNTAPSIPLFFRADHVFSIHGEGDCIALGGFYRQLCVIDGAANTIKLLALENNSTYGITANVADIPWNDPNNHAEYLMGCHIDPGTNTLYFLFHRSSGSTAYLKTLSLDYTEGTPACTVVNSFTAGDGATNEHFPDNNSFSMDIENGYIFYYTEGYTGTPEARGHLRIFLLNGGGLYKHYYCQDSMPNFPFEGIKDPLLIEGKLFCAPARYTTTNSQETYWGLLSIDLTTDSIKWYAPNAVIGDGPKEITPRRLTQTTSGNIIFSCTSGVLFFNTTTEEFGIINNITTPGVFPDGVADFSFSMFSYDADGELIFIGIGSFLANSFSGVVAFPASGKIEQPQYFDVVYSGDWNFGTANPLIKGTRDYGAGIAVDPTTKGLYAFWTGWSSSEGQKLKWAKESGTLDLTSGIVLGQPITQSRSIDAPGKLTFTIEKGHLYDTHNRASLLSGYLKKGKKILFRWGEQIGGANYWQDGTSIYMVTSTKLTYKRGTYPSMTVECEDIKTLWDRIGITATEYYSGITPDAIMAGILQSFAGIVQTDIDLSAMSTEDAIYHQWIDTNIRGIADDLQNRYGFYFDVSLATGKITARKINGSNPINHAYGSAGNLIDYSPDDTYSSFINRVTVAGESRTEIDVETEEESVGSESGTLGFFESNRTHKIYYSDDHQKRCARPRLVKDQDVTSIGFKMGGRMRMYISAVDPAGHWVEVKVTGPNLKPVFLAGLAMIAAGKFASWHDVAFKHNLVTAGTMICLQVLGAIGNYSFTIHACPIGQIRQTFQASANDTELQNELRGTIVEQRIDDAMVYDVSQAQQVANHELWIAKAQRNRIKGSKTAHLQDDAGDTITMPHPYTGQTQKTFITNLTRKMTIPPPGTTGGEWTDALEGWVIEE